MTGRVGVLAITAILAHLLGPGEFGTVAIALALIALLDRLADAGLTQALVAAPADRLGASADSVFTAALALSALLAASLAAAAIPLSHYFADAELDGVIALLALALPLRALGSTHYALAQRRLEFRGRAIAEFAEVATRAAVGIPLAIAGAGVWSLVASFLAGTAALTVALWIVVDWRPRARLDRVVLRALAPFGLKLSGVDIAGTVISQLDYIFIGKLLGPLALGVYTLAFRIPELLIVNLALVAGQVLYPGFAALDRDALARGFLISLRYSALIALPAATIAAILSEPLLVSLFGEGWRSGAATMRILCASSLLLALGIPGGTILKASGRAGRLLALALARLIGLAVLLAIFASDGIEAVAWCVLGGSLAGEAAALVLARSVAGFEWSAPPRALAPALAAALAAAPAALAALRIGSEPLAVVVGAGAATMSALLALRLLAPETIGYLRGHLFGRGSAPAPAPEITGAGT